MRTHRVARLVAILLFLAALVYLCGGLAIGLPLWSRGLGEGWGSGFSGWLAIPILAGTLLGTITLLVFGAILYFLARIDTNLTTARQNPPVAADVPASAAITSEVALVVPPEADPIPVEPIVVGVAAAVTGAAVHEETPPPEAEAETVVNLEPAFAGDGAAAMAAVAGSVVAGGVAAAAHKDKAASVGTSAALDSAADAGVVAATATAIPQVEIGPLEMVEPEAKRALVKTPPPDLDSELPADADAAPQEFTGKLPGADEAARIASEMSGGGEPSKPEA